MSASYKKKAEKEIIRQLLEYYVEKDKKSGKKERCFTLTTSDDNLSEFEKKCIRGEIGLKAFLSDIDAKIILDLYYMLYENNHLYFTPAVYHKILTDEGLTEEEFGLDEGGINSIKKLKKLIKYATDLDEEEEYGTQVDGLKIVDENPRFHTVKQIYDRYF